MLTALLPVALMIVSASAHAQVVGADGMDGADCFTSGCFAGNGTDGESVTGGGNAFGGNGGDGGDALVFNAPFFGTGGNGGNGGSASASGTAVGGDGGNAGDFQPVGDPGFPGNGGDAVASGSGTVTAIGGAGGRGIDQGVRVISGAGGNATADSSSTANGSGNAISSATANGGGAKDGFGLSQSGNASATSSATAGSGSATASATATLGGGGFFFSPVANATSYAETAGGGLAQARAQGDGGGEVQATAKTTFGGVSAQSTVELFGGGSTEATAQGGSGQSPVNPGFNGLTFATALPNAAYATTLIGSASNVADALLGPDDKIFGTAILEGFNSSSTFDFSYRGDLLLGMINGGADIIVNGTELLAIGDVEDTVFDLGSFGPNIELTISGGVGAFIIGGAVPEPSTWVMLLLGFAGLGCMGYRQAKRPSQPL